MKEFEVKMKIHLIIIIFIFLNSLKLVHSNEHFINELNKINANVVFLRHTLAPGFGDPKNFNLDKCNTQRNLNKEGILQARKIGKFLIDNKIEFTEILSSEWCRCKDTINEMNIGYWNTFSGLNSYFQNFSDKNEVLSLLYEKLKNLKTNDLVLFITHQVVISEVTNISPPSGGIVIYNTKSKNTKLISNFIK